MIIYGISMLLFGLFMGYICPYKKKKKNIYLGGNLAIKISDIFAIQYSHKQYKIIHSNGHCLTIDINDGRDACEEYHKILDIWIKNK